MPTPTAPGGERTAQALVAAGALLAALGVAAGAFGAHAVAGAVSPERLATFRTGAQYHLVHAAALVLAGLVHARWPARAVRVAGALFGAGIALFAGSLYALVLLDLPVLGAVAPLGGGAFIGGWAALAWGVYRAPAGDA